jgi:predicted NAD/FAD-dependent oxidoreductase
VAGLTAARSLGDVGHEVVVVDKGRRPGGRLATTEFAGGARGDHGAQFFTVRSTELEREFDRWMADGVVHEWCRGFAAPDGHPRYVGTGGMAALAAGLARGLDVRQSSHVDAIVPADGAWSVSWPSGHGTPAGSLAADVVLLTCPVPQSAALLGPGVDIPEIAYDPTLSLVVALDGPAAVPPPGGVQLTGDPVWSWVGDNQAKGASTAPAVTLHTTTAVAAERWDDDAETLTADLLAAATPWLGASAVDVRLHRWRFATPVQPWPERWLEVAPGAFLAGDAFGGPRIEGAYLSGRAVADRITARL